MKDYTGFDLWADGYDQTVQMAEEADEYPFAGYTQVLSDIYAQMRRRGARRVLDVGFGTGVLAAKLYGDGIAVTGIDFSPRMMEIAREKMPGAELICHDFSFGLPEALAGREYDAIICTYAIHHINEESQIDLVRQMQDHLAAEGRIYIGDVAFENEVQREKCRKEAGDDWDEEEFYPVAAQYRRCFPGLVFEQISFCAGVITISGKR